MYLEKLLGIIIKEARKRKGLSQTDLANLLGITKTAVSNYENRRLPSLDVLLRIAKILDIDLGDLEPLKNHVDGQ